MKDKNENCNKNDINIYDEFLLLKDGDEQQNIKLILKHKDELMEMFKNKFEVDDYMNSYYKYLKQITLDETNN